MTESKGQTGGNILFYTICHFVTVCKIGEQTFQSYFFQVGNLMVQQKLQIGTLLFVSIIAILKFMAISNVDDNSTQGFKYSDYQKVLDKKQVIIFSPSSWLVFDL